MIQIIFIFLAAIVVVFAGFACDATVQVPYHAESHDLSPRAGGICAGE
jgi:hypothetical protein